MRWKREVCFLFEHEAQCLGGFHGAPPRRKRRGIGFAATFLQAMEADGEVAQGDHVAGGSGLADLAGVLPEADIAHIVGSVFNALPVPDGGVQEFLGSHFLSGAAGDVVGDFTTGRSGGMGGIDDQSLDGQDLPAAAEADFLRAHAHGLGAAAHDAPVLLDPFGIFFRREKKPGRACTGRVPKCRSGCP